MADQVMTVRCVCGWETSGSEDDVVVATTEHGRALHNMIPTREEVLAMAVRPSDAADAGPASQAIG